MCHLRLHRASGCANWCCTPCRPDVTLTECIHCAVSTPSSGLQMALQAEPDTLLARHPVAEELHACAAHCALQFRRHQAAAYR